MDKNDKKIGTQSFAAQNSFYLLFSCISGASAFTKKCPLLGRRGHKTFQGAGS
ncbi:MULTISPECIES: hypothetical protein [unclassified Methanosarcina]|uniref:hypothetical protein n=1 Tax=unclassified Methanosarcina TaxID=2644672 RepID=UPI0012E02510|nr:MULTISPECIES: hypothetical protein [unclassified Methanosarcina]